MSSAWLLVCAATATRLPAADQAREHLDQREGLARPWRRLHDGEVAAAREVLDEVGSELLVLACRSSAGAHALAPSSIWRTSSTSRSVSPSSVAISTGTGAFPWVSQAPGPSFAFQTRLLRRLVRSRGIGDDEADLFAEPVSVGRLGSGP